MTDLVAENRTVDDEALPLPERCKLATIALLLFTRLVNHLSSDDSRTEAKQRESTEQRAAFLASLPASQREAVAQALDGLIESGLAVSEETYQTIWNSGLTWIATVYGDDAKRFALRAAVVQHKHSISA